MITRGNQISARAIVVQNENWGNRGLFRLNVTYGVVTPKISVLGSSSPLPVCDYAFPAIIPLSRSYRP